MLDKISLVLVIIGAINWALIGIFQFDLVAYLFGGQAAVVSRIVYTLVGAAGPKGDTGETGPQGPKGDTGAQGFNKYYPEGVVNRQIAEKLAAELRARADWNAELDLARSEGAEASQIEIAKKLLKKEFNIKDIAEITGLTEDEIEKLK